MQIKRFSELTKEELNEIIEVHFNHWVKYNPQMMKENTELPLGFALVDDDGYLVGFCVLKKENLKKYPEISPWLSDVMILEGYRGKGYGKILVSYAEELLKELGYDTIYVWTDQAPDFYQKLGFIYQQEVEKNEGGYGQLFYKKLC